jgi:hypothetical protein
MLAEQQVCPSVPKQDISLGAPGDGVAAGTGDHLVTSATGQNLVGTTAGMDLVVRCCSEQLVRAIGATNHLGCRIGQRRRREGNDQREGSNTRANTRKLHARKLRRKKVGSLSEAR